MAKQDKIARLRYSPLADIFNIEKLNEDGRWDIIAMYPCVRKAGDEDGDTDYIHYNAMFKMIELAALGYTIVLASEDD